MGILSLSGEFPNIAAICVDRFLMRFHAECRKRACARFMGKIARERASYTAHLMASCPGVSEASGPSPTNS